MQNHPTPEKILQTGTAFWASKTLLSAVEMGLFTELARGAERFEALRGRLGLHARGARDFLDVLGDLRAKGFDLDADWFKAQLEFRFPFCGEVEYEGMKLELRQALEPWHVMGEQGAIGGTVRFVDSSVERLQVKLEGPDPERYAVTCTPGVVDANGHSLVRRGESVEAAARIATTTLTRAE